MGGAVEMCSGVGACRKKLAGTMCPSYMATREEAHSTRGRANVLRLAMAGRLGEAGLGDEGVYEVLDLCLECRACKAECPVGVDMARFKSEFLADYWNRHGTPLRARALGNVASDLRLGQPVRAAFQLAASSAPVRWLNEKLLDIDRRRTLPAWKRQTFARWFAQARIGAAPDTSRHAVQRHVHQPLRSRDRHRGGGSAATRRLRVNVVRPGCCGRPLISQGLLADAREHAEKVVDGLFPIAERGEKILFCEPSCLSAVKEDAPSLLRGDRAAQSRGGGRSAACCSTNLPRRLDLPLRAASREHSAARPLSPEIDGPAAGDSLRCSRGFRRRRGRSGCRLLRHGGLVRLFRGITMFRRPSRIGICCLPREAMKPGDVLVAPGTSCRHQVADLGGVAAVHPAVLIRSLLKE